LPFFWHQLYGDKENGSVAQLARASNSKFEVVGSSPTGPAIFMLSKHCIEYLKLLKGLHLLIEDGEGDEEMADFIRDQMDVPWYKMSEEEIVLVDQISGDMYMISEILNGTDPKSAEKTDKGGADHETEQR
jgi:hypothetical protein